MTSAQPPSAKSWQYASTCYTCRRPFGLLFSRHHCRNCGYSVCGAHSKYKAELVHLQGPQRVCNSCHRVLLASKPSPQQKSFVKRKVPSRRLLTRSMRLHPWEVAREPKKRFQWDRDLSLDPAASLKQRRRAPTEITTINSSFPRSSTDSIAWGQSMHFHSTPKAKHHKVPPSSVDDTEDDAFVWRLPSPPHHRNNLSKSQLDGPVPVEHITLMIKTQESPRRHHNSYLSSDSTAQSSQYPMDPPTYVPVTEGRPSLSVLSVQKASSGDMDLAGLTSLMALSKQKQTLQEDIQHLHAQLAQCKADTKRMHRRKVRTRRHIVSAMAYVTEGEYFLAQLDLKRALALNDRCIMTWHVLAECLLRCHWPDEAALACSVGLELVRAPGTVALLGRIRLAQRRLDDAIACFHEALK